jgi:hypothetical protein
VLFLPWIKSYESLINRLVVSCFRIIQIQQDFVILGECLKCAFWIIDILTIHMFVKHWNIVEKKNPRHRPLLDVQMNFRHLQKWSEVCIVRCCLIVTLMSFSGIWLCKRRTDVICLSASGNLVIMSIVILG